MTRDQYRTALEAAIRRLHVSGYTSFYLHGDRATLHDTNVMAWVSGEASEIRLPDADLVVQGDDGHIVRAYLLVLGNVGMLDHAAQLRLQQLREQLAQLGVPRALCLLTQGSTATVPDAVPETELPPPVRGIRVERISFESAELVFDYLQMAKRNIFNSSNTPAAPMLIAEGLGLPEADVITACETLARANRLEVVSVGDRRFYRIP